MRHADGSHSLSNLETCGSVWACPVCAAKIGEGRRQELEKLVDAHLAAGGPIYLLTLTIPHHTFQACGDLRQAVAKAWQAVKQGRAWQEARDGMGWCGDVRALDLTHGSAGWHPHLHVLVFFEPGTARARAEEMGRWFRERWVSRIERMGFGACSPSAQDYEPVTSGGAGAYCAKWGIGRELVGGSAKRGRSGSRTPWQLLEDAAIAPDAARLFREYVAAFKGARQLTYSRTRRDEHGIIIRLGIRERYGLRERSDHELATVEGDAPPEHVCTLAPCLWRALARRRLEGRAQTVLDMTGDWNAVSHVLAAHGLAVRLGRTVGHGGHSTPVLLQLAV